MWQKWERLSGRTHGKPTNWEIGGWGDARDPGDSGDWELRERGRFGRLGASGNWEIRGIGENRYMWLKCETLSGRTHGLPTNWEVEVWGEIGEFGCLGDVRQNHYMWQKLRSSWKPGDTGANWGERKIRELREIGKNYYTRQKLRTSRNRELGDFEDSENIGTFGKLGDLGECEI